MNKNFFLKNGYCQKNLLQQNQIEIVKKAISHIYNLKKKNSNKTIINLLKKFPDKGRNRYDLLNLDLEIESIFYSKIIVNKIKKFFVGKLPEDKIRLGFADFQVLVMMPNTKKEYLGWHQDSAYFHYSRKNLTNLVVWTPFSMISSNVNGSLDLIAKSHKKGSVTHIENNYINRKKNLLAKRGKLYIDETKINLKDKVTTKIKSGESLIFDANTIHRTSVNNNNSNDIRFTLIARYKFLNKLMI